MLEKKQKDDSLCKEENDNTRTLVRQLGWITGETRSGLAFEVCQLSSILNDSKIDDVLKANKLLLKAENENTLLRFWLLASTENFEIFYQNDSSSGNLKDGGSQGGFIIYLVGENNVSSPIMWKFKKLLRVVKSAMAAEKLIQVEATEACFWLANLYIEILYCKPNVDKNIKIECFTDNQ